MNTTPKTPIMRRLFGRKASQAASPMVDWEQNYRAAAFVLKSFDCCVLREIEASYVSEVNYWRDNETEMAELDDSWSAIKDLHSQWVKARSMDEPWKAQVADLLARAMTEFDLLYGGQDMQKDTQFAAEMVSIRSQCFAIPIEGLSSRVYGGQEATGMLLYRGPEKLPKEPSARRVSWITSGPRDTVDSTIEKSTPRYREFPEGQAVVGQQINEMVVLQSFGSLQDEDGCISYVKLQEMLRLLIWSRFSSGYGPALSVSEKSISNLCRLRNDLWREHRAVSTALKQAFQWEDLSIEQLMAAWRAVLASGAVMVDTTRYIHDSRPSWRAWSGSVWVACREQYARSSKDAVIDTYPMLALPPGWEVITDADKIALEKYGRWVSLTEYEPPYSVRLV